jgi:hypothetical protein
MRHYRLTTTEQYMAYRPQPELASQITRVLDPDSLPENVTPIRPRSAGAEATFLERLEEGIPAKWLREIQRLYAESGCSALGIGRWSGSCRVSQSCAKACCSPVKLGGVLSALGGMGGPDDVSLIFSANRPTMPHTRT